MHGGEMNGMSRQQIVNVVGLQVGVRVGVAASGVTVIEWCCGSFTAAPGFVGDSCIGVLHQSMGEGEIKACTPAGIHSRQTQQLIFQLLGNTTIAQPNREQCVE